MSGIAKRFERARQARKSRLYGWLWQRYGEVSALLCGRRGDYLALIETIRTDPEELPVPSRQLLRKTWLNVQKDKELGAAAGVKRELSGKRSETTSKALPPAVMPPRAEPKLTTDAEATISAFLKRIP
jgi:hypothetical protein